MQPTYPTEYAYVEPRVDEGRPLDIGYVDYSLMGWLRVLKLLRLYRVWQSFKEQSSDLKAGACTRSHFRST